MAREFEPVRPERVESVRAGDIPGERRIVDAGIQALAHGALACPGCNLPIWPAGGIHAGSELRCSFCDHRDRAHRFLVPDVYDTVGNEVLLVAKIAPSAI